MGNEALAVEVFQYWKFSEGGFIVLMEQYKESLNCLLFHTLQKKKKKRAWKSSKCFFIPNVEENLFLWLQSDS